MYSLDTLTKREAVILKICPPAIITSAILGQWEREDFYNHLSNYTNKTIIRLRLVNIGEYSPRLRLGEYLVNKPLPAAGLSADNVRGWEIVRKMNIWPRSEASRANVKFWGQSLSQGHYQPIDQQAGKGVYLFYNPPINFLRN